MSVDFIRIDFVIKERKSPVSLEKKLLIYAEHNLNVLLIGSHGIGKTVVTQSVAEKTGMQFKYYSASTLDPFADLVGIPVPDNDKKHVNFCRPVTLEEAEFIFFDELNRAHPRVLQAVLEIIQFKSINGTPLPNLKMVWAAINPPGEDYQVEELDPVLVDRFHMQLTMVANIYMPYMKTKMPDEIAAALRDWWNDDLNEEQRKVVTPRRVEYLGTMIDKGIPHRDCFPHGHVLPIPSLDKRIKIAKGEEVDIIVSKDKILENPEEYLEHMRIDKSLAIEISKIVTKLSPSQIFTCRDIIEEMPKELVLKVGKPKMPLIKRPLFKLFKDAGLDMEKYQKIYEAYDFSNYEVEENAESEGSSAPNSVGP